LKFLKNIFFVFSAILILLPSAVSFSHIFSGHGHELCDNYSEKHFHSKTLDCDLHNYQKKPVFSVSLPEYQLVLNSGKTQLTPEYYQFLNEYEPLHFELRGPPRFA
jgi:hypothetical protein